MTKQFFKIILSCLFCYTQVYAQQTAIKYLSGTGKDDTVNWDFFCTKGMKSGQWTKIGVPSCWELQGFGQYDYGYAKDSLRGKEEGLYRYQFSVPSNWQEKQVNIVFEGVMTDAVVKINGVQAGAIHQGAFYSFKYNISKLLHFGTNNLLEVTVAKHSANASVNAAERKADFWIFGGIFRPVFLEALPKISIEKIAIDAKASGALLANINASINADACKLQLYTSAGVKFGNQIDAQYNKTTNQFAFSHKFIAPKLWSAEFPNVYLAKISLYAKGKIVHSIQQKFGFRTIEVKQRDGIYINGVKVKMKGVNRHSFWPSSGRTTSVALSIEDVRLMKDMNMNAVRMSHYPPDAHFLDVCDSLGLYVMDELTGWHGYYDTPTGTQLVNELIAHDQNHPSIIFWNNGNEGGHNTSLDHLFLEQDLQHRPVLHPWELFGGFDTQHYREFNYGVGNYENGHDIIMPTEFLHGLYDGGHAAGLEDYWEAMWNNPLAAGGFLWDFADEGVVRTDKNGMIDTDGNHGADGIVGPYHEKEGSYFAIKEIWSPIHIAKKEITTAFDGILNIENRYHFTNINQCSFSFKLLNFTTQKTQLGKALSGSILPLQKGNIALQLPINWKDFDVIYVTAKDPNNKEIFTWSFPIALPKTTAAKLVIKEGLHEVKMVLKDSLYEISVADIRLVINQHNGLLTQVANAKGILPFNNGPVLQEGVANFKGFSTRYNGKDLIIESVFDKKTSYNTLQWTIYSSGWVQLKIKYFPAAYFTDFVGVNFSFPESQIKGVSYLGNGPYRVWKNRMKGNALGVWTKLYNNTETGETWNYPEYKGYHSNLYWCEFNTLPSKFTVVTENEDVFLRLFTPAFKDDAWHNYLLNFPSGNISFMQGISAIGNKSQRSETTGPMGTKNIFYDYEKDPKRALELILYFNFSAN